jgi:phosphate transport system substrate-binding protein
MRVTARSLAAALLAAGVVLSNSVQPASAAEEQPLHWVGCGISKKAFMAELAAAYEKKTGVKIVLEGGGATKGIRQVSAREVQLGGSCRHTLENAGTISPVAEERRVIMTPVAWDALAVIVNKNNPVSDISLEQIRKIYKGELTNWKELGGNDAPIELYIRKGKISGVGRTARELIFANYDEEFVATHVVKSSGPLEKGIEKNPNGIGITGVSSARKRDAKILSLEGKEPSYENIANGGYLLYRPLYLVTHLQEKNDHVKEFVAFAHSEEGKKVIRSVGTVPYEDAISLWVKYLDQQQRALAAGLSAQR